MNGIARPIRAARLAEAPVLAQARRISVVMVVYMTGQALQESLAHVLAEPLVGELVVVDNGSSPREAAWLADLATRHGDRVTLLSGHGNIGFASGANLGARHARGELLLFLNPDAFLQPGCVAALAREVDARPSPCLVGGRVLNADRTEQRGARRGEITPLSALISISGLARTIPGWRRYEVHWEGEVLPDQAVEAPTISGACFCMRRSDFAAIGGFDQKYFLHVEDIDLCWRVRRAGGTVLFHPSAEVVHLGQTSLANPVKVEFHKGVGLARYFYKRAEGFGGRLAAGAMAPLVISMAVARSLIGSRRTTP